MGRLRRSATGTLPIGLVAALRVLRTIFGKRTAEAIGRFLVQEHIFLLASILFF